MNACILLTQCPDVTVLLFLWSCGLQRPKQTLFITLCCCYLTLYTLTSYATVVPSPNQSISADKVSNTFVSADYLMTYHRFIITPMLSHADVWSGNTWRHILKQYRKLFSELFLNVVFLFYSKYRTFNCSLKKITCSPHDSVHLFSLPICHSGSWGIWCLCSAVKERGHPGQFDKQPVSLPPRDN